MSLKETLALLITADSRGAISAIEKVGSAADKDLGKTEDRIQAMGKKLTSVGAGMIATGGVLVAGFAAAAFASEDADRSVIKLQNSMANNSKLAQTNAKEFTDLAEAIQGKTAADADAIVSGQSILAQFGLTADQIKELTPLAVDLAQKMGIDMDTAFKMVAKSVGGSGGALKKAGIDIDATKLKTDAYGATVEALRNSVGGFAEQEGQTFSGTLQRLKNELGDLAEGVGKGSAQAFQTMLTPVISLTDTLGSLDPTLLATIGRMGTFGATGLVAGGGIAVMGGQLLKLKEQLTLADGSMSKFGKAGLIVAGALVAGALAQEAWSQRNGQMTLRMKEFADVVDRDLDATAAKFGRAMEAGAGSMEKLGKQMAEQSIPQAYRYAEALERIGKPSDEFRKGVEATKSSLAAAKVDQKEHSEAIEGEAEMLEERAVPSLKEYQSGLQAAEEAQRGLTASIKAATDPWFAALDSMGNNREAADKVTEAQKALTEAIKTYGASSPEAVAATKALEDAQLASAKSAIEVQTSMHNLEVGVKNGTVSINDAVFALQGMVSQGLINQESADALIAKMKGIDATRLGIDGSTMTIAMDLDMSLATRKLNAWMAQGTFAAQVREGRGLASGGPVRANTAYVVGEDGPEVFVSNTSGTIIPNGGTTGTPVAAGGVVFQPGAIVVNAGLGTNGTELGRAIISEIEKAFRNGVPAGPATRAAISG